MGGTEVVRPTSPMLQDAIGFGGPRREGGIHPVDRLHPHSRLLFFVSELLDGLDLLRRLCRTLVHLRLLLQLMLKTLGAARNRLCCRGQGQRKRRGSFSQQSVIFAEGLRLSPSMCSSRIMCRCSKTARAPSRSWLERTARVWRPRCRAWIFTAASSRSLISAISLP